MVFNSPDVRLEPPEDFFFPAKAVGFSVGRKHNLKHLQNKTWDKKAFPKMCFFRDGGCPELTTAFVVATSGATSFLVQIEFDRGF